MTDYNKEIKQAMQELKYLRILNAYHEYVFDIKQKTQRKFMNFSMLGLFLLVFFGIIMSNYWPFFFGSLGAIMVVGIYLILDSIFLIKWKRALDLLIKKINEK